MNIKEKIANHLKDYNINDNTCDEIADKIINDIIDIIPKDGADDNAKRKYTIEYDDLDSSYQMEYDGCVLGWQDCINEIKKILK